MIYRVFRVMAQFSDLKRQRRNCFVIRLVFNCLVFLIQLPAIILLHTLRKVRVNVKMKRVRVTIVAVRKISITYSECVSVALVTQHTMCTRLPVEYPLFLAYIKK